jgi:hypothetical protein
MRCGPQDSCAFILCRDLLREKKGSGQAIVSALGITSYWKVLISNATRYGEQDERQACAGNIDKIERQNESMSL